MYSVVVLGRITESIGERGAQSALMKGRAHLATSINCLPLPFSKLVNLPSPWEHKNLRGGALDFNILNI